MFLQKVALATGLICGLMFGTAEAATFSFSFSGDPVAPGTVTGLLFGLNNNSTAQTPTAVEITSAPNGVTNAFLTTISGSFDTSNGTITNGNLLALQGSNVGLGLNSTGLGVNSYDNTATATIVANAGGFAGATYSQVAAVPLPGAAPLFGAALLCLAGIGYRIKLRRPAVV